MASDSERYKDPNHPLGWVSGNSTSEQAEKGRLERERFGAGNQSPQQANESWAQYQERLHGRY